jgi:hypothetical protein
MTVPKHRKKDSASMHIVEISAAMHIAATSKKKLLISQFGTSVARLCGH